ncbi:Membrane protein involved in the export of O-antigen and teichoic acid [Cyclobacterium xiamenense]|uniref:Membrane protein involved in the export of O-antigen and teichoic acid n=1 Tax=Cyclobacterium xiamenense TaxID=1297121 RepID=A0A1H6T0H2_9BACT|nr:oligosaccharide flippase family protein [Cyclobacterium xiamenense]SEI73603.1 Membrane protein involved in the export of O-antigen and teichoic acid [Cyclobacterium xiamenense]
MSDKKYWLKSGFFTMMHRGVDFLLGFVGFMLLVRILSPEDFGVWVLLITITAILDMARNGFIQNGMIKFIVGKNSAVQRKIQTAALLLNTSLTLLILVLLVLAASPLARLFHAPKLAEILTIYAWVLPVLVFHTHNLVLMQARYDFKAYFLAGISKSLPFFLIIALSYLFKQELSLYALAWYQNAAFALATLMSAYQVRTYFRVQWKAKNYWLAKVFHFGKYVFGTNLISMLTNGLDKFLLGALLSPVQVAMANSAGRVMNVVEIPVNSIASISYPKAAEAHDSKQTASLGTLYEKTLGMMLSLTIPFWLFCLLFAQQIILLIAGEAYLEAVPFLRIMAFLALIKPFDRQSGVFLDAIGKPFINMIMVLGTFLYGAGLSWLFIRWIGLPGAAYGLVTAVFCTALIKHLILRKYLPIRFFHCLLQAVNMYPSMLRSIQEKVAKR